MCVYLCVFACAYVTTIKAKDAKTQDVWEGWREEMEKGK